MLFAVLVCSKTFGCYDHNALFEFGASCWSSKWISSTKRKSVAYTDFGRIHNRFGDISSKFGSNHAGKEMIT